MRELLVKEKYPLYKIPKEYYADNIKVFGRQSLMKFNEILIIFESYTHQK